MFCQLEDSGLYPVWIKCPVSSTTIDKYYAHRIKESNSIRGKSSCVSSEKPLSNIVCKFELSTNLTLGKIPETYGFNLNNVALSELDFVWDFADISLEFRGSVRVIFHGRNMSGRRFSWYVCEIATKSNR